MIDPTAQAITRISEKLERLRAEGWSRHAEQLGVESHRFRCDRPAREDDLVRFERRHGISLPEGYRAFLLRVGDGGAGPYYGILPLSRWGDALSLDGPMPDDILARPSPLSLELEPRPDWWEQLGCTRDEAWQGAITIGHQGCAFYTLLVVSGALRGRVVYVDLDDQPPFVVSDASFLDWYERWLDETLAGVEVFWFGMGPGGSDDSLIADSRSSSPHVRATAAGELGRRKLPTATVTQAILAATTDQVPEVRASALQALRYSGSQAVAAGIAALTDPAPKGREAAAWLLRRLADPAAAPALRLALATAPSHDAFFGICCALADMRALRVIDLEPHVGNPCERVRGSAMYFLGTTRDRSAVDMLVARLDDEAPTVRRYAVQALRDIGDRRAKAALEARRAVETDELVLTNIALAIRKLR